MLDIDIITLEPITSFSDLRDTDFYKANLNTDCVQKLWLYTKGFSIIDVSPSSLIYLMANFWPLKATLGQSTSAACVV